MSIAMLLWFLSTLKRKPSQKKGCIDAIIPAYNEGPSLAQSLDNLLRNPYFLPGNLRKRRLHGQYRSGHGGSQTQMGRPLCCRHAKKYR